MSEEKHFDLLLILPRQDIELDISKEEPETGWWQQIGHGILATEAIENGWSVKILDASTYNSQHDFECDLITYHPRIAGITPSITTKDNSLKTLKLLKDCGVEVTVVGGHMVSQFRTLQNICREYSDLVDIVCLGDGRGVFNRSKERFLKSANIGFENMVSTTSLKSNTISLTEYSEIIQSSFATNIEDGHPIRYQNLYDLDRYWYKYQTNYLEKHSINNVANIYKKPVAIQTMQGCPFRKKRACLFCSRMEKNLRCQSSEMVFQEIDDIRMAGGDSLIVIEDSGILASRNLAKELARNWRKDIGIVFMYANIKNICSENASLLRSMNCRRVFVGVESGDVDCLRSLGKSYNPEDILNACRVLREYDILISPSFIIGAPPCNGFSGESDSTIENTLRLIEKMMEIVNVDLSYANILLPCDGNAAYEMLLDRLPNQERTSIVNDAFPSCEKLKILWCKYVLEVSYDKACEFRERIISMFPKNLIVNEYQT